MTTDAFHLGILTALFSGLFGLVFGSIELIKRRFGISPEITRRMAHLATGGLVILDYLYLPNWLFVALVASGAAAFWALSRFKLLTSVNDVSRKTIGQYILSFGYLAAYFLSLEEPRNFIPVVCIVALADSLAGLTGSIAKAPSKTWGGTLVFFAVALAVLLISGITGLLAAFLVATATAAIERYSPLGFDNITVPIAAAALLLLV